MATQVIFDKPLTIQQLIAANLIHDGDAGMIQGQLMADGSSSLSFIDIKMSDGFDYTNYLLPAFNRAYTDFSEYSRELNAEGNLDVKLPDHKLPLTMRRASFEDMAAVTGLAEVPQDLRMFSRLLNVPEVALSPLPYTAYLYLKDSYLVLMGMSAEQSLLMGSSARDKPLPDEA